MEKSYTKAIWTLPDDFDTEEAFLRSVPRLDMTSSPGFPYCREATTNGIWLKWTGLEACPIQLKRLWYDVQLVLKGQFEMILRAFIKLEPHKISKCLQKRWRLIMAAPLSVQIAWHMCFSYMNDIEIKRAYDIPSQQGMVMVGGDWKLFLRSWHSRGLTSSLDKSAWDWTAPRWTLDMDLEFRRRMGRGERLLHWYDMAGSLYEAMFGHPTIVTSAGHLFKQMHPGIMKSGCVNTISTNSHCQVFVHLAVCRLTSVSYLPLPVTCGDDTLNHPRHVMDLEAYKHFGIQVKSVSDTMEFMGHEFTLDGPKPMYGMKHLTNVLATTDLIFPDFLDSMARMYVHVTEYFEFWEELARRNGTPLRLSREAYLYWYDYAT